MDEMFASLSKMGHSMLQLWKTLYGKIQAGAKLPLDVASE